MQTEKLKDSTFLKSYYLYAIMITCLVAVLFVGDKAFAAPAAPIKSQYTQPNGTSFYAGQQGDETFNWITANDGAVITQNADGYWYYAEIDSNRLVAGPIKYAVQSPPAGFLTSKDVAPIHKYYSNLKMAETSEGSRSSKAPVFDDARWEALTDQDLSSPHPLLVVLVEFSDVALTTTESDWQSLIFGTSGKTVNNFYKESSNNQFYFTPANENGGTANNGVIKVTLNSAHPNTDGDVGNPNRLLVEAALNAANAQVNFATYDTNNNGYISVDELHIMTIIAGQEAAYGDPAYANIPSVWGHRWMQLDEDSPTIDGVKLLSFDGGGAYTQFGEKQGDHQATVGIIVHELGHDLDLPDLYDVDPSNGEGDTLGVGGYSVMDMGSWASLLLEEAGATPVHFDAWSKVFLGFETPINIPYGTDVTATLNAVQTTDPSTYNIYKIKTGNPDEYFLLENRQQGEDSGFDQGLQAFTASSGIAIWHIDLQAIDRGNFYLLNDIFPLGVSLENYSEYPLDPFYYGGYTFNSYTAPNSSYNNEDVSGVSIMVNAASDYSMEVKAGVGPLLTDAPAINPYSNSLFFTTEWDEAGEVYYEVLPHGDDSPSIEQLLQGEDASGNLTALSGHVSVAANSADTIIVDGLTGTSSYDLYMIGVDAEGHLGGWDMYSFTTTVSAAMNVGSPAISEAAANDGSITATQTVTVTNGAFDSSIAKADVTINNLPAGLDYTVTRTSGSVLTIGFTGQAQNHANAADVNNVSVTVAQAKIAGATVDLTSGTFAIDFQDPVPTLTVGSATISEADANNGSITATQIVTLTNGNFDSSIAKADVTINGLPAGLDYTVARTSDTELTITFTGQAANHTNANDVSNVSITVAQAKIAGAAGNVTSNTFAIDFKAPESTPSIPSVSVEPIGPKVTENGANGVLIEQLESEVGKDEHGKATETWKVDSESLKKAFEALNGQQVSANRIEIPVSMTADKAAIVELPAGEWLENAIDGKKDTVISITSGSAGYNLPVSALDLEAVAQRLGVDPKDTFVNVTMRQITGEEADKIAQSAKASGFVMADPAIEFNVTVTAKGKTEEISDFGSTYVSRSIILNQSVNGLTASVVVYDPESGKMSFVPATFSVVNGKTYVTIQRNGNSIYTVVQSDKTFDDIQDHWARQDIEQLASKALIKGMTEKAFAPDQFITRAQFAAILAQGLGLSEAQMAVSFSDVKGSDWYAGYVGAAVKAGLVKGFSDGTFRPNEKITREQMAVMIANAVLFAGKEPGDKASQEQILARFKDQADLSQWSKASVSDVIEAGIMNGVKSDEFRPSEFASRAQAAVIVKRLLVHLHFIN